MSPFSTARSIYTALATDKVAEAKIREETKEIALAIATDPNKSFELTSSTVNGQTFSGVRTVTNHDRLQILTLVVSMYDAGGALPRTSTPLF